MSLQIYKLWYDYIFLFVCAVMMGFLENFGWLLLDIKRDEFSLKGS